MASEDVDIECISAVTVFVADMARTVRFYTALGFPLIYGGEDAPFSSFRAGTGYVNTARGQAPTTLWGRTIVYVSDVDAMHRRVLAAGYTPAMAPADAPWGERYFHVCDPDGNELSFARPLTGGAID